MRLLFYCVTGTGFTCTQGLDRPGRGNNNKEKQYNNKNKHTQKGHKKTKKRKETVYNNLR